MAEETEQQQAAGNGAEQGESSVSTALDGLSAFLGKDEIEALKKEAAVPTGQQSQEGDQGQGNEGEGQGEGEGGEEGDQNAPAEQTDEEKAAAEATKKAAEEEAKTKKSIFGIKKPGEKKGNEIAIEKPEEILGVLNQKFGMAMKEPKELTKFIEVSQGWRAKAEKAEELETKNTQIIDFLSSLPEDLIESLKMAERGEDYREAFVNKPKFDYSLPADKQDIKTLVNTYYPGKFTDADFADEEPAELLKVVIDASKDKFNAEKQVHDAKRVQITQKAAESLKAQNLAIQNSVTRLNQAFPEMEKENFTKVESTIKGGPQQVLSVFFNNDGTAKPEAAELLAMAMYGKEEIDRMINVTTNQTETKVNEDLLSRGADTKKPVRTSGTTEKISEYVKERTAELDRIAKQSQRTF